MRRDISNGGTGNTLTRRLRRRGRVRAWRNQWRLIALRGGGGRVCVRGRRRGKAEELLFVRGEESRSLVPVIEELGAGFERAWTRL